MRREMWDVKCEMWKKKGAAAPDAGGRLRNQQINWSSDSRDEGQDTSGRGEEVRRTRSRVSGSLDVGRMWRCIRMQGTLQRKSGRTGRRGRRKYVACVRTQRRQIRRRIRFCWCNQHRSCGISYIPRFAMPIVNGTVLDMSDRQSYRLCASET